MVPGQSPVVLYKRRARI